MKDASENLVPRQPVAIVGMSCRFPGAPTPEAFWEMLRHGRDAVREIPADRWAVDDYYDADPATPDKTHQRHAALLDDIHAFDPLFFSISPAEAAEMNPSQKLALELVWEAVERSAMPHKQVQGTHTGVYIGNIWSDFEHYRKHQHARVTPHSAVGQSANIIANRISFSFGFTGPSMVIDTGCSSSLVALHLACQALWDGSISLGVVAGVNHLLDPDQYILLSKFGGLSVKGRCSTFDADADGFVRGEGGGVLLVKTLAQAERDGDRIYAVIRGTAMNNNGYNETLPATSVAGQRQLLTEAYAHSGLLPNMIHYVEAHGTGTRRGDPTEAQALGEFFRTGRTRPLHIGSVKTNIGHLEAAAGMAGLIKVILAMQHRQLPPSLHFRRPNPNIPFDTLKLHVQQAAGPWPAGTGELLRAGINSFGWGGTNAHTVLEEYRPVVPPRATRTAPARYCLPLSAASNSALHAYVAAYRQHLGHASPDALADSCMATALRKPALAHRALFTAPDCAGMLQALDRFLQEGTTTTPQTPGTARVVMVFSGQGGQWLGMGTVLYRQEPVFRRAIDACAAAYTPYVDWSLTDQLGATPDTSRLAEIQVVQPVLCAIQIALARLWISWGIAVQGVVGHSMGEVAAAHIAGSLTLEDAARIICTRSRLLKIISGQGAMAVTDLSLAEAETWLKQYPDLTVAVSNSPTSTVLAGDRLTMNTFVQALEQAQRFVRPVNVDVASHSRQVDPLQEPLRHALRALKPAKAAIAFYSTVHGRKVDGTTLDARYWADNLRNTVQFATVVRSLLVEAPTLFLEVGPHPVLINALHECAATCPGSIYSTLASGHRDTNEHDTLYQSLAALYQQGYDIPWHRFYQGHQGAPILLPAYPFQRDRYTVHARTAPRAIRTAATAAPLLGQRIPLAGFDSLFYWDTTLSLDTFPYLQDHRAQGEVVLPGATYIELVLEAITSLALNGTPVLSAIRFLQPVTIAPGDHVRLQLRLQRDGERYTFGCFCAREAADGTTWHVVAEGLMQLPARPETPPPPLSVYPFHLQSGPAYYEALTTLGLPYGPAFRQLQELQSNEVHSTVHFSLRASDVVHRAAGRYRVHPALLDACFQPLFYRVLAEPGRGFHGAATYLTGVGLLQVLAPTPAPDQLLEGTAVLHTPEIDEAQGRIVVTADIFVRTGDGTLFLYLRGLEGVVLDTGRETRRREALRQWFYTVQWEKVQAPAPPVTALQGTWLVLGDPCGLSDLVVEKMEHAGLHCIHVAPDNAFTRVGLHQYTLDYTSPDGYHQLLHAVDAGTGESLTGILLMSSLSYTWKDPSLTADSLEEYQVYGSLSLLYLVQALVRRQATAHPQVVVVTNGIHAVGRADDVAQPLHSPLAGLTRVLGNELPHYRARCIDLSANPSYDELYRVVDALHPTAEQVLAFRGGDRYVPRLRQPVISPPPIAETVFRQNATYLVTGFRGIAFAFVEWMVRRGARNIALVSRSADVPPALEARFAALEAQGCRLRLFAADAGDYESLHAVMTHIDTTMAPLRGVVHAAGIIHAQPLADITTDDLRDTLHPKMKGAWNLHLLTQHRTLDCFILFSSASALIGLSGQGGYVAANTFLDALAHSRRCMGLPGMSINWGVMLDSGMVADTEGLEAYARAEGFIPATMNEALHAFEALYPDNPVQAGLLRLDAAVMAQYYTTLAQTPYFRGLLTTHSTTTATTQAFTIPADPEARTAYLLQRVILHTAAIVHMPAVQISPSMTFRSLGLDSIMAVQLRNLLEAETGVTLSVAMFWSHPSLQTFAAFLSHSVEGTAAVPTMPPAADPARWFTIPRPAPTAALRLVCLHDAGGDGALFQGWEMLLGANIELILVELPGRGRHLEDPAYDDVDSLLRDLVPALLPSLDRPFIIFGHSLGGLLAFELVRALRRGKHPLPQRLFVSSTPALMTYKAHEYDPAMPDAALITAFPHLAQTPGDVAWQQYKRRLLRQDLQLVYRYSHHREAPIDIPVTVLFGDDDPRVSALQAAAWERETTSGCTVVSRPGGHRFIDQDTAYITSLMLAEVPAVPAGITPNR
ncbi:type I polyketide synthase [Parachryseolinea silvisoli]|uniref:type I polyketide synthase n=1 Tax=Parachryseolinea silvisoli TaxID=2873601 RepID=UPI002265D6E6|nr:type I polyketide synthase [Parachryseolinea silvisoli]MCD9019919.1 alpha/beta fold hydrolase [Parachryseolinea silvisoli]